MARALSAVERREYVRAVIRITRHQGRLTTAEALVRANLPEMCQGREAA